MKFNVEVEIEWLGENGDLDEAVKKQIIDHIVIRLEKKFVDQITDDAKRQVDAKIGDLVTKLFDGFLSKPITITNSWGETVKENVTIQSLMKARLDEALSEKVDERGQTGGYGDKMTRLDYMLNHRIKKAVEVMTKDVVAKVDAKIAETLNASIKAKMSESLLAKVDVDGITKQALAQLQK